MSLKDLDFDDKEVIIQDIYDRAEELGLSLCPHEVGPALRFHYTDQPMNEILNVVMKPIDLDGSDLSVFSVIHNNSGCCIGTSSGYAGDRWNADHRLVFLHSKKK